MAIYSKSAFGPPLKNTLRMQTGVAPIYLFGSLDAHTEPFKFRITNIAGTGTVATATVVLTSGGGGVDPLTNQPPIPVVGAVMGVRGLSHSGFNTDPTTVTGVTLTNGAGTITYANATSQTSIADFGDLVVLPYEYPDVNVGSGATSIPVAQTFTPDDADNSRCLCCEAVWGGTIPTTATVELQWANVDIDARYQPVQNAYGTLSTTGVIVAQSNALATVTAGAVAQSGAMYQFVMGKFLRAKIISMTGGDATTSLVVTMFS